jgi:flagellar biosynthesis protein FlhB
VSDDDATEKPHAATPKRRQDFRDDGKFARAKDAGAVAGVGAVTAVLAGSHDAMGDALAKFFSACHGDLTAITRGDGFVILAAVPTTLLALAATPILAAAIAGVAIGGAQSGFRLYPKMLEPKFEKLNPFPQLKEMLNAKRAGWEITITILRVIVVGTVCFSALQDELPGLMGLGGASIGAAIAATGRVLVVMTSKALIALVLLSAMDFLYQHHRIEKQMRMSTQEIKDEMKQNELDGQLKGRMRAKARELSRQGMIAAVGEADVIVTNPTHFAVAVRYADEDGSPVVVAKGTDALALRIRTEARKFGIPIIENRPLARALYAEIDLGHPIGVGHYVAVAEVLAFVYRIRGGRRRAKR